MNKIWRVILSASLVILIALLTFNATLDFTTSYSLTEDTKEITNTEDNTKNVEEQNEQKEEKKQRESNNKILFYSGVVLLIVLVGAMLLVFISKSEDNL